MSVDNSDAGVDIWQFVKTRKRYWLPPVLLLVGVVVLLVSQSSPAPEFIYPTY